MLATQTIAPELDDVAKSDSLTTCIVHKIQCYQDDKEIPALKTTAIDKNLRHLWVLGLEQLEARWVDEFNTWSTGQKEVTAVLFSFTTLYHEVSQG